MFARFLQLIASAPVLAFRTALLLIIGCGAVAAACADETLGHAQDFLQLPQALKPASFRNTDRLFATRPFQRGPAVYPLPRAKQPLTAISYSLGGTRYGLEDFIKRNNVAGLLVLSQGSIALERYALGNTDKSRWNSFSVGKSIVSTLVGAAVKDGYIDSIDDPISRYLPQLYGSAYERATIRNLLQMSSGVRWNEDYRETGSDIGKLLSCVAARTPDCIVDFMARLPKSAAPGTVFNYSTGETHLLGMAVMAATHKTLSAYLSEKIWAPFGMESDGYWTLESSNGIEMGGGSLAMTLRDYGRFGEFIRRGGIIGNELVLPAGWVAQATQPRIDSPQVNFGNLGPGDPLGYGYQWWLMPHQAPHDGSFQAEGIFGQYIYINPAQRLVIVVWSAWPEAWVEQNDLETVTFFGAVIAALKST